MDNFDLKKFLTENKLTSVTRLAEKAHPTLLQGDVNKAHSTLGPKLETHLLNFGHDIPLTNAQALNKFLYDIVKSLKTFAIDLPRNPEVTPQAFDKFKDILTRFQDYKIGPEAGYEIVTLLLSKDTYEDPTTASLKGFGQAVAGTQRENKLTNHPRKMNEQASGVQIKGVPFPNPNSTNEVLSITYISDGSPYRPGVIYNEVEDYIYSNLEHQAMGEYVIDTVTVIGGTPEDLQVIADDLIDDAQDQNYSGKPIINPSEGTIVFDPVLSYAFDEPGTWYI